MVSGGVTIMDKDLPSPEYLRKRLRYCPETGKLFWRDNHEAPRNWNTKHANTEAFTTFHPGGYRAGRINNRSFLAHRVIWAIVNGEWPKFEIDHIDHIRHNNRIDNLRCVTRFENAKNRTRQINNKSGICGVRFRGDLRKWSVEIKANGKREHLGYYENLNDAVAARKAAERKHSFHENHGM